MKQRIKQIFALLLLSVFIAYITPKEVCHLFTHHTDTLHVCIDKKDGLQISNEHHHCALLKLDQHLIANDWLEMPFIQGQAQVVYIDCVTLSYQQTFFASAFYSSQLLRGPPFSFQFYI